MPPKDPQVANKGPHAELRHARNSAVVGRTLCGLVQFNGRVRFAFSRSQTTCPDCLAVIARLSKTRPEHARQQHLARRRQQLENVPLRKYRDES